MSTPRPLFPRSGGFTLIEVAVTLVIVGLALTMCMQSLFTAKVSAVQTTHVKLARELGQQTLGQIESGLFREEIHTGYSGSYAEEGHPDFTFEVVLGDDTFLDDDREDAYRDRGAFHDTFAARREREYEAQRASDEDEEEEETEQPFEKVRVRVMFPKAGEYTPYLDQERWMPWTQVYGEEEEEEQQQQDQTGGSGS